MSDNVEQTVGRTATYCNCIHLIQAIYNFIKPDG